MLFQVLSLVLMVSVCMFEAVSVEEYASSKFSARANLVLCVTNEIFLFSYLGEEIQHESQKISSLIYDTNWYHLSFSSAEPKLLKQFNSLMQMTTMRADRPIKLSAGGFTSMSYQTFMSVSVVRKKKLKINENSFLGDEILLFNCYTLDANQKINFNQIWSHKLKS